MTIIPVTMNDVKEFIEKRLADAEECSSADMVTNCRAQAFGVIMFAQKFIPFDDLNDYWEKQGIWQKFNNIAREKKR